MIFDANQPEREEYKSDDGADAHPVKVPKQDDKMAVRYPDPTGHVSLDKAPSPKTLTICLAEEPSSLYILSTEARGWGHIQEALRDGPIEQRMFTYQPVILEKLPHWEDGDVWVTPISVQPGEGMVDVDGKLVNLELGVYYWTPDLTQKAAQGSEAVTTIQMHVRFRLRPDVSWSDGEMLTAADSVFGFQVASDEDTPTYKTLAWRTADYIAIGTQTIEWTGLAGYLNHDYVMSFAEPLPMHVYGHLSAAELLTNQQVNRKPLGWGAFRVSEWVDGSYLRLVRNEHYFRAPDGLPYLDELLFVFTETETEALKQLTDGVCHVAVRDQWDAWETHVGSIISAQSTQQLAPQFVTGPMLEHIDFGIRPTENYGRPTGNDLLESSDIRKAIAYCLDREAMVEAVQWGQGIVAHSYVPPNHPMYGGDKVAVYAFNPDQGRTILSSLGWEVNNSTWVRSRDSVPLTLRYSTDLSQDYPGRLRQTLAEIIRANLRLCGIELIVEPTSAEEMYAEWPEGVIFGRKFDLAEYAWLLPGEPRCELYITEQIPENDGEGGINSTGYSNPEFDTACDQALWALYRVEALQRHQMAQKLFADDLPSLPLFFHLRIGVARPELIGFNIDPTHPSPLWNIESLDLYDDR